MATSPSRRKMSKKDLDAKVYGKKPVFSSEETILDNAAREATLRYSLRWYSNYYDKKKSCQFVVDWLTKQSYFEITNEEVAKIEQNWNSFLPTFYSIMRMESDGWVLSDKEIQQIKEFVFEVISAIPKKEKTDDNSTQKSTTPKRSPQELLKEKVNTTILSELEDVFETWMFANNPADRKKEFDINERIASSNIPSAGINIVKQWIEDNLNELTQVKAKSDPDLVEGYSNIKMVNLNNAIKKLTELKNTLGIVVKSAAKNRKPRKRKVVSTQKIFSRFKYQTEEKDLGLRSLSPEKILDAKILFLFNTKYKTITVLYASSENNFEVKGTTIQNIDESLSFKQKLRKPSETLSFILSTSSKKRIETHLSSLSTKPGTATGRCNEDTIILKIL